MQADVFISNAQEFLRNPDRYIRLGARPPRGVLLVRLTSRDRMLLFVA